ncbi:MAG: hypothetical protein HZB15_12370 [Actinobacteria bacterium]|nr:hypothetical protein [Actinomycetota bacterium]
MSTDDDLAKVLKALQKADEKGTPYDNEMLASKLGWDLDRTASALEALKERSMIWGERGARKPGPWFSALEVTVQGRRFLRSRS